jgi:ABC-type glycerol-3-phosphate transport system substrate-binding protein
LLPLDELIAQDVWDDFTPPLLEMTKVWDQYKGETFRVHHNFEACYWWYRKDWFEEKQIPVPTTWQEVSALGKVFTDKETGVWASAEGMIKRAYLNVYIAWITRQAGGNPYDVDDSLRVALEYIDDLIHKYSVLNAACLQKNYDQQNSDYIADRVAFMRQWPFFYDVTRQHESWYSEEKVACGFPPVGPGGKSNSTYAAGWGFGIPKTAENVQPSKELIRFLIATENAEKMVEFSTWFLNARRSILASAGDKGLAKYLRMYTDAGIIATRPFHPSYTEVLAVLEDSVSAFLTNKIGLEECLKRSREGIARA